MSWPNRNYITCEKIIREGIQQGIFTPTEEILSKDYLKLKEDIDNIFKEIAALRDEIAELHNTGENADRIHILNEKIRIAIKHDEQTQALIKQMETMPLMIKILQYAKTEQSRRLREQCTGHRTLPKEREETETDLCAYICGIGKKPVKYLQQEIEKLANEIAINKAKIANLGFCIFGKKAQQRKKLKKEIATLEERMHKLGILLRTKNIDEANRILFRNINFLN